MAARPLAAFFVLCGLVCASPARAQRAPTPEIWQPVTLGPWVALTSYIPDAGELLFRPVLFYRSIRGQFSREAVLERTPGLSQLGVEAGFGLQLGLTPRIAIGMQPTLLYERTRAGDVIDRRAGLGRTPISGQLVLLRESAFPVPQVTLMTVVKAPTSTIPSRPESPGSPPAGPNTWDTGAGLSVGKALRPAQLHLEAVVSRPLSARLAGAPLKEGLYALWSSSLELVSERRRLVLMLELSGLHQARTELNRIPIANSGSHELTFGAMVQVLAARNLRVGLGLQRTLWGLNTSATSSAAAVLGWVP